MAKDAKDKAKTQPQRPNTHSTKLSRTEQRQKERERETKRQRITVTGIIVAVVIVLGAAVFLATNTPADAPIPDSAARYDGLLQVTNDKGYPRIGSLDGIPVAVFTSLGCDNCNVFHNTVLPQLVDRVENGDISLTYIPVRAGTLVNFNGATRSALCAGQQGKFFQYADAAVHWQELYGTGAFADNRLQTGATNLGLDKGRFDACRSSAPEGTVFQNGQTDIGGRATDVVIPSVMVNNIIVVDEEGIPTTSLEAVNAAIDAAISFRSGATTDPTPDTDDETIAEPTAEVSEEPTAAPTDEPTAEPTDAPTEAATETTEETATP